MKKNQKEWQEVRLGDIAKVINGYAFKSSDFKKMGIPIIKIKNIKKGGVVLNDLHFVSNNFLEEKSKYLLKFNDVLISMTGSNVNQFSSAVGQVCKFRYKEPMLLNQRVGKIEIIDNNKYDLDFLYYNISTNETHYNLAINATGSANQANISPDIIYNIILPCPPLEKQKKIASILSSLDDKIELNNRMNKILEEMAQTIFKEWFVNFNFPSEDGKPYKDSGGKMIESELGAIPEGWEITNLDYIVKVIKGKKPKEISSKKTDLLSSQYLTIDCYNNSNIEYTEYIEKMYVNKLDIIMVMDGASSGKLFYGKNGILSSTMAKFHVEDIYIKEIVFFFLKKIENEIMYHTTGSAIPHANKHFILNKKIVLPPKKLFNLINKLKMIREKIILNTEENQKLDSIRDTLLPKLMSGEIRVK